MTLITPQQPESGYVEIPYGADHAATDVGWTLTRIPNVQEIPGYFKLWIPRGRVTRIALLVFGAGSEYGTMCLSYGKLPTSWDDQGPFARHGSVPVDQLDNTTFQFSGNGQVINQVSSTPLPYGDAFIYGAIAGGNPYALQVVMEAIPVPVDPPVPAPVKVQKCTLNAGTTRLVILTGGRNPKSTETKPNKIVMEF